MFSNRCLVTSVSVIILIMTCVAYREDMVFQNLYGYSEDAETVLETLQTFSTGAMKFHREGENFVAHEIRDTTPRFNQEYDFIVVGAGSAGAAVASRLSELTDNTVLLIEAGPNEKLLMDVPIIANFLQLNDDLNWKYQTEPSTSYCQGMVDHKCNWPRGKVMGGSSVLNYMIATRGIPRDYDYWAAMGNEGWSYDDVLYYFKKLENMGINNLKYDKVMHNTGGPVNIDYPPYHTPLAESFIEAGLEMGYPIVDYNANQNIGFSYLQVTMKNGTRMSTNRAYLIPVHSRKNLFVTRLSHVNKILIDPGSRRAYGVEFTKMGFTFHVRARKEVILCAGAIGSSQILMLSGIGPAQHLRDMNIEVLQDAPVGENLMDHIAYGGLVFLIDQPVSILAKDLANPANPYINDFFHDRYGPLTIPGGLEALAFIDVDYSMTSDSYPNIELLFSGGSFASDPSFRLNVGMSHEYWLRMFAGVSERHSWGILPMLMRPKSRGRILLRDNNPNSKPRIYANYMDHPEDVRVLIKGIRTAIELSKTKAMQRFNSRFYDYVVPGCEGYLHDSNEYWECALRTYTFTIYHYSGTCKMAPVNDPTGVVSPRLQVKGIRGLRVADASIMPMIVTGHPNIPTIMIAEKLADMVKEDWGYYQGFYYY